MLLGIHNYSYHLHGLGGWVEHVPWPKQMNIWDLMDEAVRLGVDGLHLDPAALESTKPEDLAKIRTAAKERKLFLEYNTSMSFQSPEAGIRVAQMLGADIVKTTMDLKRPRPLCASRNHPEIQRQLEEKAAILKAAAPLAEETGVKIAVENHTETLSTEILWVLDQVNSPNVGACIDTVNSLMVGEDPMVAIKNLAPRAFTNHFKDHRIELHHYGCKITGVALGDGDIDLKRAFELIRDQSPTNHINIEVELEAPFDDMQQALRLEREAMERSVRYCREVLGI